MSFIDWVGTTFSPFVLAVQDTATGTTTGTPISYPATPLAGQIPKAALFVGSYHDIASGSSELARAGLSFGAVSDINQRVVAMASEDNSAATVSRSGVSNVTSFTLTRLSGVSEYAQGDATLVSGGIDVTWPAANANRRPNYVAFAGSDVTAAAANIDLGNSTSAVTVNVGFQPDVVIFFTSNNTSFTPSASQPLTMSYGVATRVGPTNRCVLMSEPTTEAAGNLPFQSLLTDSCGGMITTAGALTYKVSAGNFTSTGFDLTPSAAAGNRDIGYLALKFDGHNVSLVTFDTPTSTGNHTITGAGFTPQAAIAFVTNLSATDPSFPLTSGDDQGGLAVCSIGDEQWSHAIRINSGSDPADTASFTGNYAMIQPSATDCKAGLATLTSWDSDGVTLDWPVVQGSAKKGFILFMG